MLQDSFVINIPFLRNGLRKEMMEVIEGRDAFDAMAIPERNKLLAEREQDISYALSIPNTDKKSGPKHNSVNGPSIQMKEKEKPK